MTLLSPEVGGWRWYRQDRSLWRSTREAYVQKWTSIDKNDDVGKIITSKHLKDLVDPRRRKRNRVAISEKLAQAINTTTLLENSNATVFKSKMRSGFPCFYCRKIYINPKSLREHQDKHPKSQLFNLLKKYSVDELVVYADVTDLKCSLCDEGIPSLDILKSHLTEIHEKSMYENCPDKVIPFRLENKENNFDCQVCGRRFETFGATDRHMNVHFGNYICEECGAGFVTRQRLKMHSFLIHNKSNGVKCEPCQKVFASKYKYKIHYAYVHAKIKKTQCTHCLEKFVDYFARQRHMELKHGVEILSYKCTTCDKSFNRKYSMTDHVRRVHVRKKNVQCELCPFMCFTNTELKDHTMYVHSGNKTYECAHCDKTFATKKGMRLHIRVHSDIKRFSCHMCGETFLKGLDLTVHVKRRCPESRSMRRAEAIVNDKSRRPIHPLRPCKGLMPTNNPSRKSN